MVVYPRWIRGVRPCAPIPLFQDVMAHLNVEPSSEAASPPVVTSQCHRRLELRLLPFVDKKCNRRGPCLKSGGDQTKHASNTDFGKESDPEAFIHHHDRHHGLSLGCWALVSQRPSRPPLMMLAAASTAATAADHAEHHLVFSVSTSSGELQNHKATFLF